MDEEVKNKLVTMDEEESTIYNTSGWQLSDEQDDSFHIKERLVPVPCHKITEDLNEEEIDIAIN